MKILLFEIFTVFGEIAGGDAKQVCYLSSELGKRGREVQVLNFHFKDKFFMRDIKFIGKFFNISDKNLQADVIYASGTPFWALSTYFLGKKINAPTVLYITHCNNIRAKLIEIQDLAKISMREGGISMFLKSIINSAIFLFLVAPDLIKSKLFLRFSLRRIDKVMASCEYIKEHLGRIIDNNKIEVMYPLVENDFNYSSLSAPNTDITIFYFGAFYSGRGVIDLLYVFIRLKDKFPQLRLVIAGYPKYEDTTEQLARKMVSKYNLGSRVQISKYVSNILEELQKATIVCLPFHDSVLFQPPLTLLEALKMGKCVISTDSGAVGEFIVDSHNGFLVKPKDIDMLQAKITFLIQNQDIIKAIGENARATIKEKCNFDTNIKKIGNILQEISSAHSR